MTETEKLNYIIEALNKLEEQSKSIGELNQYSPSQPEENIFFVIFNAATEKTLKFDLQTFLTFVTDVSLEFHEHELTEVTGLSEKVFYEVNDTNGDPWRVFKDSSINPVDPNAFELKNKIEGWADGSTEKHWVEGIIIDGSIAIPADLNDSSKFRKTNEKQF